MKKQHGTTYSNQHHIVTPTLKDKGVWFDWFDWFIYLSDMSVYNSI